MYTGTTVLGEFSELQYSLSPSYQAVRLLVSIWKELLQGWEDWNYCRVQTNLEKQLFLKGLRENLENSKGFLMKFFKLRENISPET